MADPQTDQGFLPGLLGKIGGWFGSDDPAAEYGGLLSDPATKAAFRERAMGAAAQAFAQGGMPAPYKGGIPLLSTIGMAGGAASTSGDSLMKARLEAAQAGLANQTVDATKQMLPWYQAAITAAQGKDTSGAAGTGGAAGSGAPGAPAKGADIRPLARLGTGDPKAAQALLDGQYGDLIKEAAAKYNIDPVKYAAQLYTESGGDPNKVGPPNKDGVRPQGMAQIMPGTQTYLGVKNPFDPKESIFAGAKYLREGLDKTGGDYSSALKYYYSGSTDEKTYGAATNGYPGLVYSNMPKPDQTAAVPPAVPGTPAPAASPAADRRAAPLPGGALAPGAEGSELPPSAVPSPAAAGPQDASGGAYSVPPPPGPPPKPGEYAKPAAALPGGVMPGGATPVSADAPTPLIPQDQPNGPVPFRSIMPNGWREIRPENVIEPFIRNWHLGNPGPGNEADNASGGVIPVSAGGAPPGLMTPQDGGAPVPRMPGRFGAIPTALANGPGAAPAPGMPPGLVTGGPPDGAPPIVPAAAAGPPPPAPPSPAAAPPLPPGATVGEGGVVVPGLMTPQGPAAAGPQATPPVTQGPQATPGPQAAPLGAPPMPQMPTLSLPQTQMPQITPPQMPQATPGQAAAMGIAGISALIGKPAPEWIQKMAAMPGEQAMEAFKSYLQVQTQGMTEVNKKYIEMQAAPYIAAVSAAAKMPYTFVKAGESLPSGFDANGKPTGWIQAPGEPMMLDGPPNAQGQPTKRYWIPATRQLIDLGASGASPAETAAGTQRGRYQPTDVPGAPQTGVPGFTPAPTAPDPAQPVQIGRGMLMPGTNRQNLPKNYPDYEEAQKGDEGWNSWKNNLVTAQTLGGTAEAQIGMIIQAAKANEMGSGTEARATLGNFLISNMHADPDWVNKNITNVGAVQTFLYAQARDTLTTLAAVNKRFTGGEFKITSQSGASPEQLNSANLPILALDLAKVRQIQGVAEAWNQAQGTTYRDGSTWTNPRDFVSAFYQMNPLTKLQEQTMQQIGPLGGMKTVPGVPEGAAPTGKTIAGWPEYTLPGQGGTYTFPGQWKGR